MIHCDKNKEFFMSDLKKIENKIEKIKNRLMSIKEMRPGSLTCQQRKSKEKYGSYWQLSYTHLNKGRTDYIRKDYVSEVEKQVKEYKKFKSLMDEWVLLSIQHSKLKMKSS